MPPPSSYHDVHLTSDAARSSVWRAIAEHLSGWIPSRAAVLEIGAGYCDWINAIRASRKVALDVWPKMPDFAGPDVEAVVGDATDSLTIFGASAFDVVLLSNVLEHFEPDTASRLIADISRVLKANGRLIVIQPNFRYAYRQYFDDYTHRSVFTHVSLSTLIRTHGFRIERLQARFLPYSMRDRRWPTWSWLVWAYLRSPVKPFAGQMLVVAAKS